MKVNASVLVGCVMCVLLVVGIGLMYRMNKDQDQWSPNDIYHNVGGSSTSSVSSSVSSSDGVSVSMGSRSSRRYVAAPTISYAPSASMSSTSPVSSVAYSGGGLYTTSSATYKSFGGGTVSGGGASVSGGSARSAASQPGVGVAGVSMPSMASASAYSSAASASYLPATDGMLAVVNYYPGIGNTTASGPLGISGRRNASSVGGNLDDWIQGLINNDGWVYSDGTIDYFDYNRLLQLYTEAIENGDLPPGITWEQFLSWFSTKSDVYAFPISDGIWFMCILALGYGLYIAYRRKQKVVNS